MIEYHSEYEKLLSQAIDQEIEQCQEHINSGNIASMDEYKKFAGILQGLAAAKENMRLVREQLQGIQSPFDGAC